MDSEDRLGAIGDRFLDQPVVDVQGIRADVDENRPRAAQSDRIRRRDERVRRHDDFVARPQVAEHGRQFEGRRARRSHQHFADAEALLEQPSTGPRELPVAIDLARADDFGHVFQFPAGDVRLDEGNGTLHGTIPGTFGGENLAAKCQVLIVHSRSVIRKRSRFPSGRHILNNRRKAFLVQAQAKQGDRARRPNDATTLLTQPG